MGNGDVRTNLWMSNGHFTSFVFLFQNDDDGDEADEESEGGDHDDEMDAQPDPGSPASGAVIVGHDPWSMPFLSDLSEYCQMSCE